MALYKYDGTPVEGGSGGNGMSDNGFAHISFDDVCYCLNDITVNANTYTSIFNNRFFSMLKRLHDTYGATFSLFVFLRDATTGEKATGWTLANTTAKFKNEFSANSSWLKFGLHASSKNSNYGSASAETASSDYQEFVTNIVRISSLSNIDRLPRLGNFLGNQNAMLAMRNADMGIVGGLAAYDNRDSYYLNSANSTLVYKYGQMHDADNHLMFYTSLMALETTTPQSVFNARNTASTATRFYNLEWMMHEYAVGGQDYGYSSYDYDTMATRLEDACKISVNNGYNWSFPMFSALRSGL